MTLTRHRPQAAVSAARDAARAALGSAVDEAAARAGRSARPVLASATVLAEVVDPIAVFAPVVASRAQAAAWIHPASGLATIAMGAAWAVDSSGAQRFSEVASAWRRLLIDAVVSGAKDLDGSGPRLMGAFGFADDASITPTWTGFEQARFVLPEWQYSVSPQGAALTLNRLVRPDDAVGGRSVDAIAERAASGLAAVRDDAVGTAVPQVRIVGSRPDQDIWQASVARIAGAVGRGRIDKAVLTRSVDLVADATIDVGAVLARLQAGAADSTIFAVSRDGRVFLGATPESLITARGRAFSTVAMAGSTQRGDDDAEDAELARRLLESDKEREEHAIVVRMIRATLAPLAAELEIPSAPGVVRLRHVQHLATPISGVLAEDAGAIDLVARLHPTPAVGGTPTDLALELIADEERHERGWYAGPIGWVDAAGDGEFAVALRSGVVDGDRATLLAGCGIVADSDPEREWQESQDKLQALGSALGHVAT